MKNRDKNTNFYLISNKSLLHFLKKLIHVIIFSLCLTKQKKSRSSCERDSQFAITSLLVRPEVLLVVEDTLLDVVAFQQCQDRILDQLADVPVGGVIQR